MATWVVELTIWQLGLPEVLAVPWGHRGRANAPNLHPHAKKSRKKQPVAPPDASPYRKAISGRKQELDQEATPGRRNFFHRTIRSKPKL
jgi:hypothetical protein